MQPEKINTQVRYSADASAAAFRFCPVRQLLRNHQAGDIRIFQRNAQKFRVSAKSQQRNAGSRSAQPQSGEFSITDQLPVRQADFR